MKSTLLPLVVLLFLGALVIWVAGVRIVVYSHSPAPPEYGPQTMIVWDAHDLALIESPQAICEREGNGHSASCIGRSMIGIIKGSKRLITMPFSQIIYRMSGASQ